MRAAGSNALPERAVKINWLRIFYITIYTVTEIGSYKEKQGFL